MIIHVKAEYSWGSLGTLWVKPSGSVTVGNHNPQERPCLWWPLNWIVIIPILIFYAVPLTLYRKQKNNRS